jgi:hypothetical protein
VHINYRSTLQNHIITNTEQKCMMLLPFERGMFAVFDLRPTCDAADVQAIIPFPPNPLKHVLCDVTDCSSDYRTIPNVTRTVRNRHKFRDLATLPTQVMA